MKRIWLWLLLLGGTAAVQTGIALRSGLWADEVFSLAMATGHSVEHPARLADPARGDFVEPPEAVPVEWFRGYMTFPERGAGWTGVLRAVRLSDTSPPLYYLLLHGWLRIFGTGDFALRAFSMIAALGCVPLVFALGRRLAGERAGWIAAGLFAASPLALYYGTEGRMYALWWLCVLVTALASWDWGENGARPRTMSLWIAGSVAGLLVHYYFVFPWAAFLAAILWQRGLAGWRAIALGVAGVVVLIAPWYVQLPEVFSQWRITQDWVSWRSADYRLPRVIWEGFARPFSGDGHYLWNARGWAEVGALVVVGGSLAWALRRRTGSPFSRRAVLVWAWFGAAVTGPIVADVVRGTYVAEYPRYTTTAVPAACLLAGAAIATWRGRWAWIAAVAVVIFWIPSIGSIGKSRGRSSQPTRDAARQVSAATMAQDLVLVHSIPTGAMSLARYLDTAADMVVWVGQLGQRRVPESIESLVQGRRKVVWVKLHAVGAPAPEEEWLRQHARLSGEGRVADIYIREFRPKAGDQF